MPLKGQSARPLFITITPSIIAEDPLLFLFLIAEHRLWKKKIDAHSSGFSNRPTRQLFDFFESSSMKILVILNSNAQEVRSVSQAAFFQSRSLWTNSKYLSEEYRILACTRRTSAGDLLFTINIVNYGVAEGIWLKHAWKLSKRITCFTVFKLP